MIRDINGFEVSKMALELGYNEQTMYKWSISDNGKYCLKPVFEINDDYFFDEVVNKQHIELLTKGVAAPNKEQIREWLKEKFGVILVVDFFIDEIDEDETQILFENKICDVEDDYNVFSDYTYYHSYNDAFDAGLKLALNYIKKL